MSVVGINGFEGHNELFINNKDNTFTESAGKTLIIIVPLQPFDYDLDGDLDMYLLNHAVHSKNLWKLRG
jgi:hypothetical protein